MKRYHQPTPALDKPPDRTGEVYQGGLIPIGHRVEDGKLVADPKEMEAITKAIELRTEGASLRKIEAVTGISLSSLSRLFRRHG